MTFNKKESNILLKAKNALEEMFDGKLKGNTIWGDMCEPEEIKRWPIEENVNTIKYRIHKTL